VFEGVPQFEIASPDEERDMLDLLAVETGIFGSKGEARRLITAGGVGINKQKVTQPDQRITKEDFINNKYLLVQKGKKNYYLIRVKESGAGTGK
jgi:tyrosyl-tRNA synthetase